MPQFVYFLACYFIGSIMTAYFLVKYLKKEDIRSAGSGNVGARNAGRVYGKKFFILTFLGDATKGIIVLSIGQYFGFSDIVQLFGLLFALTGHILPLTLHFKGGKGVATFIGGIVFFEPHIALYLPIIFILIYTIFRNFSIAGLISLLTISPCIYYFSHSLKESLLTLLLVVVIIVAHTQNRKIEGAKHDE